MRTLVAIAFVAGCGRIGFETIADGGTTTDGVGSAQSFEGAVLFVEHFDDINFTARGWYDTPGGLTSTTEHAPGSVASFECDFALGSSACVDGVPGRYAFASTDPLFVSFWIKLSPGFADAAAIANWLSDADAMFAGPFSSHLTIVEDTEASGAVTMVTTDSLNIDPSCIELPDSSIVGCGGNFATYPFGENRAVSGCNGAPLDVTTWNCYLSGTYGNGMFRISSATPYSDGNWHFLEAYFAMSTVSAGIGQHDGVVRFWVDGTPILAYDDVEYRTGAQPALAWGQLALAPFVNNDATVAETLWLDELTIAKGVVP